MSAFTLVYTRAYTIQFYSDDVNIPFPNVVKSVTNTSAIPNKLVDISGNFSGIQVGDTVVKMTGTQDSAYVIGIENNTTLLLSKDLSLLIGDVCDIHQGQNYGCYIYVPYIDYTVDGSGSLQVETIGGDVVSFFNPPAGILPVQVVKVMSATDIAKLRALW